MRIINIGPLILIMAVLPQGCAHNTYVIETPMDAPSICVIPSNYYDSKAVSFGSEIENLLLRFHMKVIERPSIQMQDTDAQITQGSADADSFGSVSRPVRLFDATAMIPSAKSDLVAITYRETRRVRILRSSDRALVASIDIPKDGTGESVLYSALAYAHLIKDEGFDESNCRIQSVNLGVAPQGSGVQVRGR